MSGLQCMFLVIFQDDLNAKTWLIASWGGRLLAGRYIVH